MQPNRLFIAVAGAFFSAASFWMSLPLIAVTLHGCGLGSAWIGLICGLPWLALLILSPVMPKIVAHLGLQRTVLTGILTSIVVLTGFAMTRSVAMWGLLLFLQGGTLALRWAAMDAWIAGAVPDNSRGRLVAMYEMVASLSMAAGPGLLAVLGLGRTPFAVCVALAALAAILVLAAGREPPIPVVAQAALRPWRIISLERAAFVGIFLVGFTESANVTLLPVAALGLGVAPRAAALLVMVVQAGVAAGAMVFGMLADWFSRRMILVATALAASLAPLVVPVLLGDGAAWPVLLVWGVAQGSLFTLGMVMLGVRFQGPALAPAVALAMAVYTMGGIFGPPCIGGLLTLIGPYGMTYGLAGVSFIALAAGSCFEVFRPHVVLLRSDTNGRPA
jgi:CP family cyanate transporter-like MFS transporter